MTKRVGRYVFHCSVVYPEYRHWSVRNIEGVCQMFLGRVLIEFGKLL